MNSQDERSGLSMASKCLERLKVKSEMKKKVKSEAQLSWQSLGQRELEPDHFVPMGLGFSRKKKWEEKKNKGELVQEEHRSCGGMSTARKHTWAELRLRRQHHPARALGASAAFAVLGRAPNARTPVPGRCLERAATSRRISVHGLRAWEQTKWAG